MLFENCLKIGLYILCCYHGYCKTWLLQLVNNQIFKIAIIIMIVTMQHLDMAQLEGSLQ